MAEHRINGLLVVGEAKGVYCGADREVWDVLSEKYYSRSLPSSLEKFYRTMDKRRNFWWPFATDLDTTRVALEYTRQFVPGAQLLGVYSPYVESIGSTPWLQGNLTALGTDVVGVGEWSLLRELLDSEVALPSSFALNSNGLLDDDRDCIRVEALYRAAALKEQVEQIAEPDPRVPVEAVWVGVLES